MKTHIRVLVVLSLLVAAGCRRDTAEQPAPVDSTAPGTTSQAADTSSATAQTPQPGLAACVDSAGRTPVVMLQDFVAAYKDALPVVRDSAFHALWVKWYDIAQNCYPGEPIESSLYSEDKAVTKAADKQLSDLGFDWISNEGMVSLVPYVPAALEIAGPLLSPSARRYLELSDIRTYRNAYNDAGIIIEYTELADRVFAWADTSLHQPSCVFREEAAQELKSYMYSLLSGAENTRVFWDEPESDSMRVDEAFLIAYRHVVDKYAGHPLAQIVQEYLSLITGPSFNPKRDLPTFAEKYPDYCGLGMYTN